MPPPIRRKDHPVPVPIASRMLPVFALQRGTRLLRDSRSSDFTGRAFDAAAFASGYGLVSC